ncbi:MAG: M20/M25/M40 family metallo-hydrolase [Acetobacteraceae bacterium]|nr:M20/M25/M40 family metallo-hydrolase [Acetobacteraceae bacterium]
MSSADRLADVLAYTDATMEEARGRLFDLLRIPSISAQPAHAGDCQRAAGWVRDQLAAIGFATEIHPTKGQPVVLGRHPGPEGYSGPTILFYGHYDVQPADPLELWKSDPFEPQLIDGPHGQRIVARGAVDDKGQVLMFLEALRAWHTVGGGIPVRIIVLIEGEEEVSSPNLDPFLRAHAPDLAADFALISDTGMWNIDTPALTTRLRGITYMQVTVKAAKRDLHSGLFGGSALNPINTLTRILGELTDAEGRIQVPEFYDGIAPVSNAQIAEWEALGFDEKAFLGDIGLSVPVGERGYSGLQRLWARPTADICGIWGGYTGPGAKTVIAAEASAKVSFRLVPGQDPAKVAAGFRQFVNDRLPRDARAEFENFGMSPGIVVNTATKWVGAAKQALADEFSRPPVMIGCGGSIPVVESLHRILGIDTLLMGFGLEDDGVHSPNEKFEWRCFQHGLRAHVRLLGKLSGA